MVEEKIIVTARYVDKLTGGLKTTRNTINQFGQTTKTVNKQFKQMADGTRKVVKQTTKATKVVQSAKIAHKGFAGVMGMNLTQWRQYNAMGGKFKTIGGRAANTFRKMTHGLRGFRMEMLGVMFFGMGLQKFFTGLLKPAMKMTGLTELLSNVLAVLFLPIVLKIIDFLLPWIDRIMNLSDETKLFIGKIVLWGAAIGTALFLVGMFALGIGSLILVFGGLFMIFKGVFDIVYKLFGGGALGGAAASMLVLFPTVEGLSTIFKKLGQVWEWIKEKLGPVWGLISEKIKGFIGETEIGLLPLWDNIKAKVKEFTEDFKTELTEQGIDVDAWIQDFKDAFGLGEGGVQGIWDSMVSKWDNDVKPMWESFKTSIQALIDLSPDFNTVLESMVKVLALIADEMERISENKFASILGGLVGFKLGGIPGAIVGAGLLSRVSEAAGKVQEEIAARRLYGVPVPGTGFTPLPPSQEVNITIGGTITATPGSTDEAGLFQRIGDFITRHLADIARR